MNIDITIGVAIGAVLAALINIYWSYKIARLDDKNNKEESIRLLAGELLSVAHHFSVPLFPIRYLDEDMKQRTEVMRRLRLAKYGALKASEDTSLFGFLSAEHIRNVHQLANKIRNFDILIDEFLAEPECNDVDLYRMIESRKDYIEDCSQLILAYINEHHPEYESLISQSTVNGEPNYLI
ncbi:hypothetical protein J8L98_04885 [Pseudoalteromonas sp. MMG013]|nr:hypothetical protein [Pseudoalteromonas sp. MMG013]MBQ4861032.1 hypothetical protein [Pseudoalteromonas sp. MMG013]